MSAEDRFSRSRALLGAAAMERLAAARVLVVGVGGVGGWCAEALVRTGLGHLVLMDDDVVVASNLNRQCPALVPALGRAKVEAMAERLRLVNPSAEIIPLVRRYTGGEWLGGYDAVVDAIDSVDCKARLILDARAARTPLVSSMGAARRLDPGAVRTTRFARVEGDGLARALRQRFRRLGVGKVDFPAVWSGEQSAPEADGVKGSLMQVTATFGMHLAAAVVKALGEAEVVGGERAVRAVVAFGSNLEPRRDYLETALERVGGFPRTRLLAASDIEETEPIGVPEEFASLKFLNRVAIFETKLGAQEFADRMHAVEDTLGRVRTVRNGPRTIDIDLIDWGGTASDDPALTLPHPRAAERDFVSRPWRELVSRLAADG